MSILEQVYILIAQLYMHLSAGTLCWNARPNIFLSTVLVVTLETKNG